MWGALRVRCWLLCFGWPPRKRALTGEERAGLWPRGLAAFQVLDPTPELPHALTHVGLTGEWGRWGDGPTENVQCENVSRVRAVRVKVRRGESARLDVLDGLVGAAVWARAGAQSGVGRGQAQPSPAQPRRAFLHSLFLRYVVMSHSYESSRQTPTKPGALCNLST